jgi:TetR/AcrR family transcriptional regulator
MPRGTAIASTPRPVERPALARHILQVAKPLFAQHGYGGVSIDRIAQQAGISKQNLLYYFARKELLYREVLSDVLDVWLSYMDALSQREDDPEAALREYIAGKLRFSREHPHDSRVYANEVIAGAPHFADEIERRVIPALQADVRVFRRWARKGLCRPIDARHLMVVLWSATQAYADFAKQIELVLGKAQLSTQDFKVAEAQLVDMVLRAVLAAPPSLAKVGATAQRTAPVAPRRRIRATA